MRKNKPKNIAEELHTTYKIKMGGKFYSDRIIESKIENKKKEYQNGKKKRKKK